MTILRKKKPYTCRNEVLAGFASRKPCAAILSETDGSICAPCAKAISEGRKSFLDAPITKPGAAGAGESLDQLIDRRKGLPPIWPTGEPDAISDAFTPNREHPASAALFELDEVTTAEQAAELDAAPCRLAAARNRRRTMSAPGSWAMRGPQNKLHFYRWETDGLDHRAVCGATDQSFVYSMTQEPDRAQCCGRCLRSYDAPVVKEKP